MPLQHAYAFLLVASEEGHSVSEYAKRAGTTQAVMTRILFALSSRKRESGYGLVQQVIDPQDGAQDTDVPDRQRQGAGARNSAIGQI
jgi:DNA-binding MarR family transcriptional regulator